MAPPHYPLHCFYIKIRDRICKGIMYFNYSIEKKSTLELLLRKNVLIPQNFSCHILMDCSLRCVGHFPALADCEMVLGLSWDRTGFQSKVGIIQNFVNFMQTITNRDQITKILPSYHQIQDLMRNLAQENNLLFCCCRHFMKIFHLKQIFKFSSIGILCWYFGNI